VKDKSEGAGRVQTWDPEFTATIKTVRIAEERRLRSLEPTNPYARSAEASPEEQGLGLSIPLISFHPAPFLW